MLKLFLDQVHSEVGFELEDTPRFARFDVIFASSQEQEIGDQRDSQGFFDARQLLGHLVFA